MRKVEPPALGDLTVHCDAIWLGGYRMMVASTLRRLWELPIFCAIQGRLFFRYSLNVLCLKLHDQRRSLVFVAFTH